MIGPRGGRCRGGVLPLALGVGAVLLLAAAGVLAAGMAQVAAARAQTAADLAAVSGARAARSSGELGSAHAGAHEVVWAAARRSAGGSGARVESVLVGSGQSAPSVEVTVAAPGPLGTRARARARAGLAFLDAAEPAPGGGRGWARGSGYSGPLLYRDGKPTCPAVATAFDRMDAAARASGVDLVVTSGFRSDAEQAALFRRHPDPRWVAPPGRSRHRDATELDILTTGGAGAWLRANGERFAFLQRYSWEPWHWGYLPGCGSGGAGTGGPRGGSPAVPAWVPAPYRGLVRSTALRERLSPALLAALLRTESGFDPRAVSPAGARGIAQLMPATARGLGVLDPFDPGQAIPAAGRLLRGHLGAFGTVSLALAAYNAGPGAVRRYGGVPPFAETQAYVAKVLALAGEVGGAADVVLLSLRGPLV